MMTKIFILAKQQVIEIIFDGKYNKSVDYDFETESIVIDLKKYKDKKAKHC